MGYSIGRFLWRTFKPRKDAEVKQGFTLLELIVVIVILGIMATLAATQYTKMVEKSRGAEARIILGSVRTNQAAMRLQNGSCSSVGVNVGIGSDYSSACTGQTIHYFSYALSAAVGNSFTVMAARCTTQGKSPFYSVAATVTLTTNFDNGLDSWTAVAPY